MTVTNPERPAALADSPRFPLIGLLQDAFLVAIFATFAIVHGTRMVEDRVFTAVPLVLLNTIYATLFLARRRTRVVSHRWQDWSVAAVGGFLPFVLRPEDSFSTETAAVGVGVQTLGLLLASVSVGTLGKSFGIVAANRGLKTGGTYALVRHPIYAAHLLTDAGFLIANPSAVNCAIVVTILVAQLLRIRAEERVLGASSDYAAYRSRVRYRLVPGIY